MSYPLAHPQRAFVRSLRCRQRQQRDRLGIGLSISRAVIAAHDGRLWAEINPGPGRYVLLRGAGRTIESGQLSDRRVRGFGSASYRCPSDHAAAWGSAQHGAAKEKGWSSTAIPRTLLGETQHPLQKHPVNHHRARQCAGFPPSEAFVRSRRTRWSLSSRHFPDRGNAQPDPRSAGDCRVGRRRRNWS